MFVYSGWKYLSLKHKLVCPFVFVVGRGGRGLGGGWKTNDGNRLLLPLISLLPYIGMYYASTSDPGIITKENHYRAMRVYPYDRINFQPGVVCRTCLLYKPARSKHCPICMECLSIYYMS